VKAGYAGGKFAYNTVDKRVAAYAESEGISKSMAWGRVRAEAIRRGDRGVERAADAVLKHAAPLLAPSLLPDYSVRWPGQPTTAPPRPGRRGNG
jgi:hypothetical protein